jgi:peptidoglycan biosynthesis protein MviN/MurJ (putative lipid II flippase)
VREETKHAVWGPWLLGWCGLLVLALANGTLRALVTQPRLGETAARALATAILLAALTALVWWLHRRRPIPTSRQAWAIGAAWVVLTLAFEFGWGGLVAGLPWSTMLADYDLSAGRIWILVPIWTALAPTVVRRAQLREPTVVR